jgi:hypothetical protein
VYDIITIYKLLQNFCQVFNVMKLSAENAARKCL